MKTFVQAMLFVAALVLSSPAFAFSGSTNAFNINNGTLGVTVNSWTDSYWRVVDTNTQQVVADGFVYWNYGSAYYVSGGGDLDGVDVSGTGETSSSNGDVSFSVTGLPAGSYSVIVDLPSYGGGQTFLGDNYLSLYYYWDGSSDGQVQYFLSPD